MIDVIIKWICKKFGFYEIPNAETLKAIEQIEREENLIKSVDIDDLFKKLNI